MRESNSEARLADATCPGECQQAAGAEKATELRNLLLTPDEAAELMWQVVALNARAGGSSWGSEGFSFKTVYSQRDQLGVADVQLASFPAGDRVASYAQRPPKISLAQVQRLPTSAKISGAHGA